MIAWEALLQGNRTIVLDLEYNGRQFSIPMDREDADELSQRLNELVIESELDDCVDEDDDWLDDEEDCA